MFKVYIKDISFIKDQKHFDDIFSILPKYRQEKILKLKNETDKKLSLLVGYLIHFAFYDLCDDLYPLTDKEIKVDEETGAQYMTYNGVYFSASHSGTKAMVVFSSVSVGCDIQLIDDKKEKDNIKLAKRFFADYEYEHIANSKNPNDEFYKYWTIKESFLKLTWEGLKGGLKKITIKDNELSDPYYQFVSYKHEKNYRVSYVVGRPMTLRARVADTDYHVIGEALVDIIRDENGEKVNPGGAPFNVAYDLKRLFKKVHFYTSVGDDKYGRFLEKTAKKCKFNSCFIDKQKGKKTTQALVSLNNGDRSFRFVRDDKTDCDLSMKVVKKMGFKRDNFVHLGSLMLSEPKGRKFFFDVCHYAHENGVRISFDVNYREGIFKSEKQAISILRTAIKYADLVKMSKEESFLLSGKDNVKDAIEELTEEYQAVFVTDGENGSIGKYLDDYAKVAAPKVNPVDTTGAGDAFFAHVLHNVDWGEVSPLEGILDSANLYAAASTLNYGGFANVDHDLMTKVLNEQTKDE